MKLYTGVDVTLLRANPRAAVSAFEKINCEPGINPATL
jgi:hypothetical protein